MEKSKIKNLKIRLKAGVLTAVALIPGVSCGRNVEKQEPGANVSIETEANTEKNTSNIITTTTTKGNKTTTNTFVTESTNNNGYVNNNKNNGHVDNTTNSNTNSTETKTENKTNPTHQNTTQKTTTVKIKNSDIKVTNTKANTQKPTTQKPVETTAKPTTQKPVETTAVKVTEPPVTTVPYFKREYTKYDITSDEPEAAYYALNKLSSQLAKEMFNGYIYKTFSDVEAATAIIIALNYNQDINYDALGELFQYKTQDDFKNQCDELDLASLQYRFGSQVDFSKYVIDDNMAYFINNISSEYREYMNGNTEPLTNEMNNYFDNNSDYIDDYVKYYFMCNTKRTMGMEESEIDYARQLYFENVLSPMYDQFISNEHRVFVR